MGQSGTFTSGQVWGPWTLYVLALQELLQLFELGHRMVFDVRVGDL